MLSHYDVLGISPGASDIELRKQYQLLALKFHPDKPAGDHLQFTRLQEAWTVLADPHLKAEYDLQLKRDQLHQQYPISEELFLEDLQYCEDGESPVFCHECRCGGNYNITEEELLTVTDSEVAVVCDNCSLAIIVVLPPRLQPNFAPDENYERPDKHPDLETHPKDDSEVETTGLDTSSVEKSKNESENETHDNNERDVKSNEDEEKGEEVPSGASSLLYSYDNKNVSSLAPTISDSRRLGPLSPSIKVSDFSSISDERPGKKPEHILLKKSSLERVSSFSFDTTCAPEVETPSSSSSDSQSNDFSHLCPSPKSPLKYVFQS